MCIYGYYLYYVRTCVCIYANYVDLDEKQYLEYVPFLLKIKIPILLSVREYQEHVWKRISYIL